MRTGEHNLSIGQSEAQTRAVFITGAITTVVALTGILIDVIVGNITGGNLTVLPSSAADRLMQFQEHKLLALYNLDLLNMTMQCVLIPSFFALFIAHRGTNYSIALLSFVIFLFGSAVMVANNAALPMLELSNKYAAATSDPQKEMYAAAGEALLASGAHGSPGIFPGFFIPNIANLIMSVVMLRAGVFGRVTAWSGITGSILMMIYVILVNFTPGAETMATMLAMPGGLLLMLWMILFTIRLFRMKTATETRQ